MELAYASVALVQPPDVVWSVLGDFHGLAGWVRRIRSSEAEDGTGVGSVRRLTLDPDGLVARERLVSHDDPGRRYGYEFADEIPFPASAYRGNVHLLPITDTGGTFLEWYGEYECAPGLEQTLRDTFTGIYASFFADLRAKLDGG